MLGSKINITERKSTLFGVLKYNVVAVYDYVIVKQLCVGNVQRDGAVLVDDDIILVNLAQIDGIGCCALENNVFCFAENLPVKQAGFLEQNCVVNLSSVYNKLLFLRTTAQNCLFYHYINI